MNYKKNVVIIFTAICTIVTIINIGYYLLLPIYLNYKSNIDLNEAETKGIIGAADGPTTIFLARSQSDLLLAFIIAAISIIGIVYLVITKNKKRY